MRDLSFLRQHRRVFLSVLLTLCALTLAIPAAAASADESDFSPYPPPPPDAPVTGDVTLDGVTNIVDAMFIAQYTVGIRTLSDEQLHAADTTDDGIVNIVDAMHIAQYTVDPTTEGGVLFKPLWQWDGDGDVWDPLGLNDG